ncbi:uncharacterized protein LOC141787855 [Halichoeres trimaculatus]|uniref:uncharacterized protein LOC141787855 n=1 Tax=Halichoeres trimaculatus TaxID=147232 RepID=UPI003D9DC714
MLVDLEFVAIYLKDLRGALCHYVVDTLTCIDTVRRFCEIKPEWVSGRESQLNKMMDIKGRDDCIELSIRHVSQSENKGRAFKEYMKSKVTKVTAKKRHDELAEELVTVLEETLLELESLHCFLDALEKLAVTSLHVFSATEKVRLNLPKGVSLQDVHSLITAARLICPLLLQFKREAGEFFLPKMQNVDVLAYQLDRYIQITKQICEVMQKRTHCAFDLEAEKIWVLLDVNLTSEDVQRMNYHIGLLEKVRMNQHFRLVYLFNEKSCSTFMDEFSNRQPQMLKYLGELEEAAGKLNSMNKGAKISGVVGSSVGVVGGILSIIGLALIPVTAGVSLGLTATGIGLSVTSGVNSAVTTATEIGVNSKHQKKANEVFQDFMKNVQTLQNCLEEVSSQTVAVKKANPTEEAVVEGSVVTQAGATVLDSAVNAVPSVKVLQSEALVVNTGKVVVQEAKALRNVSRVATDIPDIGQAALKAPLVLSKSARVGLIGVNALFIGMDVLCLCQDSVSLSKGSESKVSQFLSARVDLWRSEIGAWEKIQDSLREGLPASEKNKKILNTPFYPETETEEQQDIRLKLPSVLGDKKQGLQPPYAVFRGCVDRKGRIELRRAGL